MKVTLEPTEEFMVLGIIPGIAMPLRIWRGTLEDGTPVRLMAFAISAESIEHHEALRAALPPYMTPEHGGQEVEITGEEDDTETVLVPTRRRRRDPGLH